MGTWDEPSRLIRREPDKDGGGHTVEVRAPDQIRFVAKVSAQGHYLGHLDGQPWFAEAVTELSEPIPSREADLSDPQRELAARALALTQWHTDAQFCERCGCRTEPADNGAFRTCPGCRSQFFPRTDPAVIVAVLDDQDRLLLAHQPSWTPGRISVLAGFVEAGESAEQACHREVSEEAGVSLSCLSFFATQPWPYPRSLMLAFFARSPDSILRVDGRELAWARFYSRTELMTEIDTGSVSLPGAVSVAHRMITAWLTGEMTVAQMRDSGSDQ